MLTIYLRIHRCFYCGSLGSINIRLSTVDIFNIIDNFCTSVVFVGNGFFYNYNNHKLIFEATGSVNR